MGILAPLWSLLFYGFVLLLFVAGLLYVRDAVGLFRDVLAMVLTRRTNVADVRDGRVEVAGTVRAADRTLTDPMTGDDCVAYEYRVTEERAIKDDLVDWTRFGYREAGRDAVAVPFRVEDDTGTVLVELGDADDVHSLDGAVTLYAPKGERIHVADPDRTPAGLDVLFRRTDLTPTDDRGRVYRTDPIRPGDDAYVLGTGRFDGQRIIGGGSDRFVVAAAGQVRTVGYSLGWGMTKLAGGAALTGVTGLFLLFSLANVLGVPLRFL